MAYWDDPIVRQVEADEARDHRRANDADDDARPADRSQPWFQFLGEIDEMLEEDRYLFAYETLNGIRETVARTRRVSDAQRRAVDNIFYSKQHAPWRRSGSRWRD